MPGPTQTAELKPEAPKPAPASESEQFQSGAAAGTPAFAERRTITGSSLPLFLSAGALPVDEPGSALEQEADRVADRVAPEGSGTINGRGSSPSDSGGPVDGQLQKALAPVLGASLEYVRVHAGPASRQSADSLEARAFTHGRDVFLGSGQSAGNARLIAHEAAHTVQQSRGAFAGIQRQPKVGPAPQPQPAPTAELTPEAAALFTPDALTQQQDKLLTELATAGTGSSRDVLEKNLGVVQNEMVKRAMAVKPYWGMRTAAKPEDKASAGQVAALQTRMDLLIVLLQTMFPTMASDAVTRLTDERTKLESLHKDDVLREGDKLEAAQGALEAIGRMNKGLPSVAPIGLEAQYEAVRKAVAAAVSDVATVRQNGRLAAAQAAGEKYLDAFSASMIQKTREMKTQLKALPESFNLANGFINGYARNNEILVGGSLTEVGTYNFRREFTLRELDSLGDLEKMQGASFADRVKFLDQNGETLTNALLRGQALQLMNAGFQSGMALMDAVTDATDQGVASDVFVARHIRNGVIAPLAAAIDDKVTDAILAKAQSVLVQEESAVRARITDVNEYLQRVGTFVQVAAIVLSLYGGMAAMEAAGGSGVTVSATGTTQVAVGQFVRGSLAFTMASSMITSGITGQPITPQGFVMQAGMDMATLGLMHMVGAGFASYYGGPAKIPLGLQATAQFTALWAWSAANALVAQPGPITGAGAVKTIAETGQHTALAMLAMGVAHRMATLPTVEKPPAVDPTIAARQSAAIAEFEQVRARGKVLEAEYNRWTESGQAPTELERLMRASESWYGTLRSKLRALSDAGIIDAQQAAAIETQVGGHVSEIRNIRDMGRLGLRETGESTVAFSGDARNLDAFLGRLVRQKTITSYEPVGRAGMYKVVDANGRVSFYYPEGPATESGRGMDLNAEALKENLPELSAETRAAAATALRSLPAGEATSAALELKGPGAKAALEWLAKLSASGKVTFLSGDLLTALANSPELLKSLSGERLADLNAWKAAYDAAKVPHLSFLSFLGEVRMRRGSLQVGGVAEAIGVGKEIGAADAPSEIRSQDSISSPDSPRTMDVADWVEIQKRRGFRGEFRRLDIDGKTWILQISGDAIQRAWIWGNGDVTGSVDVAGKLKVLRDGVALADTMPDAARQAAVLDALKPIAEQIEFLRRIRGMELAEPLRLLERVKPAVRPAVDTEAPKTETTPEPERVPVTTRDMIITRHRALMDRAVRQGALDDPIVSVLDRWNPASRKPQNIPANPLATLDLVEQRLNTARDAAVKQYTRRFGRAAMEKLQKEAFGGREDYGDFLAAASGKRGLTIEALRGLGYMTQAPPEGEPAINPAKVLEMARTPAERTMVLEQFARIFQSRPGGIPGAFRLIADMTTSGTSWRGGAWTLRALARNTHLKLTDVATFEQTESMLMDPADPKSAVTRRYDVVLKSGSRMEMKSWTRWFPDSIRSQFRRDVILQTDMLNNVSGLDNMQWLFEGTPGMTEMTPDGPRFKAMSEATARTEIGKQMELGLEDAMKELGISEARRAVIRARFRNRIGGMILIDAAAEGNTP